MIAIIDYEMGNLRSVQKGFEHGGHDARITSDPDQIAAASKIVLPGVGAFGDAMRQLTSRDLVSPIRQAIETGKPFLGICLGLQLLFDVSYEDGQFAGLGIVPGKVVRFASDGRHKVPHMGWNTAHIRQAAPVLSGIDDQTHFYFVHSYYVVPADESVVATDTVYVAPFCSMIWRDNLFATQFHPEKSQRFGLQLLDNFARL